MMAGADPPARPDPAGRQDGAGAPLVTRAGLAKAALDVLRAAFVAAVVISFAVLWFFNPRSGRALFVVVPLAALATFPRVRAVLWIWALYIIGFLVFIDLRMVSAEVFFPARYDYVIALERLLFLGRVPTVWLQERWYRLGAPTFFDLSLVGVHFSFFLAPHAIAAYLWWARREAFARYVVALVAMCWVGLLMAFVLPTAPPWLAAQEGRLPHVYRIIRDVVLQATPETYTAAYRAVGENAVAAMPSLHAALTFLIALGLIGTKRWLTVIGGVYFAAMSLALVHLGEHYVVDILAGVACAWLIWRLTAPLAASRHADPADDFA